MQFVFRKKKKKLFHTERVKTYFIWLALLANNVLNNSSQDYNIDKIMLCRLTNDQIDTWQDVT